MILLADRLTPVAFQISRTNGLQLYRVCPSALSCESWQLPLLTNLEQKISKPRDHRLQRRWTIFYHSLPKGQSCGACNGQHWNYPSKRRQTSTFHVGDKVSLIEADGRRSGPYFIATVAGSGSYTLSLADGRNVQNGARLGEQRLEAV